MGLDWFTAEHLSAEWRVLTGAPLLTFGLVVAMLALGYLAAKWRFGAKMDAMEERLRHKDDRLKEYDDKLKGASPDEARARLDALEAQVRALGPRRLTAEQ